MEYRKAVTAFSSLLGRFLYFLAGVHGPLLDHCPGHDGTKYLSIGALVLTTAIFSSLAFGYAVETVYENLPVALSVGVVWGFMILNIDRLILATFRSEAGTKGFWKHASPRILLALLIAVTVAHPLLLAIFKPEISWKIEDELTANQERIGRDWTKESEAFKREAQQDETSKDESLRSAMQSALDSVNTCNRQVASASASCSLDSDGCLQMIERMQADCTVRSRSANALQTHMNALQQQKKVGVEAEWQNSKRYKDAEDRYQKSLDKAKERAVPSLLRESVFLWDIASERLAARLTVIFVFLLFVMVEMTPILVAAFAGEDSICALAAKSTHVFKSRIVLVAWEYLSEFKRREVQPASATTSRSDKHGPEQNASIPGGAGQVVNVGNKHINFFSSGASDSPPRPRLGLALAALAVSFAVSAWLGFNWGVAMTTAQVALALIPFVSVHWPGAFRGGDGRSSPLRPQWILYFKFQAVGLVLNFILAGLLSLIRRNSGVVIHLLERVITALR